MSAPETVGISTPTDREVVVTRDFDAPRQLVYDALTRPELLRRWLKAPGRTMEICDVDLRVGGAYRFVWRGPNKRDVGMRGIHTGLVPGERIVKTESWEDWDAGETLVTEVFSETSGRTTLTSTIVFPSREVRDAVLESGLKGAAAENYDRLAEVLASANAKDSPASP